MSRFLVASLFLSVSGNLPEAGDSERVFYFGDTQLGFGNSGTEMDKLRFAAAARAVGASEAVVIAGDLVNSWNDTAQLTAFQQVWPSMFQPDQVHLIPGNHDMDSNSDDEGKFTKMLGHYRDNFGADYHSFETKHATFVLINSESLILPHLGLDGKTPSFEIINETETQWAWFEKTLETAQNRTAHTIVVSHHPPFLKTADEDHAYWNWPMADRERLLDLLTRFNVKQVLCGHTHTTTDITVDGLSIYTIAGTAKAFDQNGCGYRVLTISPTSVTQEYIRIDQGDPWLNECTKTLIHPALEEYPGLNTSFADVTLLL